MGSISVFMTVTEVDGSVYAGDSAENVVRAMKLDSWSEPRGVDNYMKQTRINVCSLYGKEFIYTDALSFLIGYCKITKAKITWEVI